MSSIEPSKKTEQSLLDGAIQGGVILGEMWIAKEMGIMKRSDNVKGVTLIGTTMISKFICDWLVKQSWYPKI